MGLGAEPDVNAAETVSVVIPAFNAERWVDETLRSVRAQTHRALEIVVVDDGSYDRTAAIVEAHARLDPRLRLVRQANGGVAVARNRGVAETTAPFVAPVDADDLWAPTKIERQLERFRALGERTALVYTRYALIDAESRIVHLDRKPGVEGDALEAMCLTNVVGNGSGAMMRRHALVEAGGYDASLRAAEAQGCEDYKLYFHIAERHGFGFVDDWLTGYRDLPDNMSSDLGQMLRSRDLCVAEFRPRHPDRASLFNRGRMRLMRFNLTRALRAGQLPAAAAIWKDMVAASPLLAAENLAAAGLNVARSKLRRRRPSAGLGGRFPIGDPDA